jgi:hypothetical protein
MVVASSIIAAANYEYKLKDALNARLKEEKEKSEPDLELIEQIEFLKIATVVTQQDNNEEAYITAVRKKALEMKIIDEVHFWNNTRNQNDEEYIKSISNIKRTSSVGIGKYISIHTPIVSNSFELNVKASNDIHVKLTNTKTTTEYEIVLGGWSNTKSVIRENNIEIYSLTQKGVADKNNYSNYYYLL